MQTIKRCWRGVKLLLMWESAAAGMFFLAVAITALVSPASVKAIESLDYFSQTRAMVEGWLPFKDSHALFVASSFTVGVFNALVALAALTRRH
jgi:hypothetical protein